MMCYSNFGDPAHAWDVYCDMQDRATRAFFREGKCMDCDDKYTGFPDDLINDGCHYGYCSDLEDWVNGDTSPRGNGCCLYDI